ncbi:MAG: DUF5946 family protein [Bacilli bacterium]
MVDCPGCGVILPDRQVQRAHGYNASGECYEKHSELTAYTLSHKGDRFIHQHVVDAYAAQHAGNGMRNITTAFALIGLYYGVEHGFSGRQVQRIHILFLLNGHWDVFCCPLCNRKGVMRVFLAPDTALVMGFVLPGTRPIGRSRNNSLLSRIRIE